MIVAVLETPATQGLIHADAAREKANQDRRLEGEGSRCSHMLVFDQSL
jgi:hypothetical protein